MWTVWIRDQIACSVQCDLDLHCPQKLYVSSSVKKEFRIIFCSAVQPSEFERRKALCGAICDILWQAGNQSRCCMCLRQEEALFDMDYTYRVDGITEKVIIQLFTKQQNFRPVQTENIFR